MAAAPTPDPTGILHDPRIAKRFILDVRATVDRVVGKRVERDVVYTTYTVVARTPDEAVAVASDRALDDEDFYEDEDDSIDEVDASIRTWEPVAPTIGLGL